MATPYVLAVNPARRRRAKRAGATKHHARRRKNPAHKTYRKRARRRNPAVMGRRRSIRRRNPSPLAGGISAAVTTAATEAAGGLAFAAACGMLQGMLATSFPSLVTTTGTGNNQDQQWSTMGQLVKAGLAVGAAYLIESAGKSDTTHALARGVLTCGLYQIAVDMNNNANSGQGIMYLSGGGDRAHPGTRWDQGYMSDRVSGLAGPRGLPVLPAKGVLPARGTLGVPLGTPLGTPLGGMLSGMRRRGLSGPASNSMSMGM